MLTPVLLLVPVVAHAYEVEMPQANALYEDGPSGRYLLGGKWLFRLDTDGAGLSEGYQKQTGTAGWQEVEVPYAWNVGDNSEASMHGTTAWYRKDFKLPSAKAALDWVVRFESVNYRTRAWLNGYPIGKNTGAYLPFELTLAALKRNGTNRLVVRVDNRRYKWDFPPSGLSKTGTPTGGWWNYGGILREVYLRKVNRIDFKQVTVRPVLPCSSCAATVQYKILLRNSAPAPQRVTLTGTYGRRKLKLGTATIAPGSVKDFSRSIAIEHPELWSPTSPKLYKATLTARVAGKSKKRGGVVARYSLHSGIRNIRVTSDGYLTLNGHRLNFRGVGLHEDAEAKGFAIDNADREELVALSQESGATVIRTHYPFHPQIHELADRLGLLIWSEIPVYSVKAKYLKREEVRKLAARELEENILANQNHPSVMLWSIGNELSAKPGPVQGYYINAAAQTARALDPTRPIGIAVAGYPQAGCQQEYDPLDVIGINEYFGWYPGPNGSIADRTKLGDFLDAFRACYPSKALVISEFGAEANRDGPVEEKGTYQYQQDFVNYHHGVYVTKPWLSGVIYWALREFRVRPEWDGGNPRPNSPIHQKGVVSYQGAHKPAFTDLQNLFRATQQIAVDAKR